MVLSSSEFGGLNIGSLKALNWSLLAKWWWRFKTEKNSLWKKVVCSFHGSDGNLGVASDIGSPVNQKLVALDSCHSRVLWTWRRPIRPGREDSELNDLQHEISSIIPSSNPDSWRWSLHPSGQFSLSALRAIIDSKLLGAFRLPTRANIDKRGIDIHSILCPFCEEQIEDEDHIFALCPFSSNIWDLIRKWRSLDVIPLDTTLNVLEMADDGDLNFSEEISSLFDVVVLCAIWWIWRARNLLVFQAVKVNMINIIDDIIATSYLWIKNRAKCCSISWVDWCCNPSILCILL
ncbi:reverse transcriptase domain, reverse transcriptase zinc-binding domain protein [Tanacetum coccineum]